MPERVAFLVIHGIGQERPYETLDRFTRNLKDCLPGNWQVEPRLDRASDPTHVSTAWIRSSLRLTPQDGSSIPYKSDPGASYQDITLYEYYWAPITQDKITYRGSLLFLLKAGLKPFFNLSSNVTTIVQAGGGTVGRVFMHEIWRQICLFLPMLAILTWLLIWMASPSTLSYFHDYKPNPARVLVLCALAIRYLFLYTCIRGLARLATPNNKSQKIRWWAPTLRTGVILHLIAWPLGLIFVLRGLAWVGSFVADRLPLLHHLGHFSTTLCQAAALVAWPASYHSLPYKVSWFFLLDPSFAFYVRPAIALLLVLFLRFLFADVVGDVARAARKYGLKFGIYLSPWDRHDPRYADNVAYDKYYQSELEELVQNYGQLTEFWLDGAGSGGHVYDFKRIIETLRTYQPNTIVFADTALFEYGDARWVGTEDGSVPYENWNVIDRHGFLRWRPVEADTPLRAYHWFWHPNDEASLKSLNDLLTTYDQTIGRGAQLMLGLAPDTRGLLPDVDVARLKEFGDAVRARYAHNLVSGHNPTTAEVAAALDNNPDTFWSAPAGSHHAVLEVDMPKPITFNRALTMEWLNDGQHVQKYSIEVWDGKGWRKITGAEAIGHEKIDTFPSVTAMRIRLNILSSSSEAHIREFQLYSVPSA